MQTGQGSGCCDCEPLLSGLKLPHIRVPKMPQAMAPGKLVKGEQSTVPTTPVQIYVEFADLRFAEWIDDLYYTFVVIVVDLVAIAGAVRFDR